MIVHPILVSTALLMSFKSIATLPRIRLCLLTVTNNDEGNSDVIVHPIMLSTALLLSFENTLATSAATVASYCVLTVVPQLLLLSLPACGSQGKAAAGPNSTITQKEEEGTGAEEEKL